jgi:hypothetical protein
MIRIVAEGISKMIDGVETAPKIFGKPLVIHFFLPGGRWR